MHDWLPNCLHLNDKEVEGKELHLDSVSDLDIRGAINNNNANSSAARTGSKTERIDSPDYALVLSTLALFAEDRESKVL